MKPKTTPLMRQVLAKVIVTHRRAGTMYRAAGSGERVTLASLHTHGLLVRRTWRGKEGDRDAAHEYEPSPAVQEAMNDPTFAAGIERLARTAS